MRCRYISSSILIFLVALLSPGMGSAERAIPISRAPFEQGTPNVVWGDAQFFVVWYDCRRAATCYDIYGSRVSRDGQILDPHGIPISIAPNWQTAPQVAWGSDMFLVVWKDERSGGKEHIYGARVSRDGRVLDPHGIPIAIGGDYNTDPHVAWGGSSFLVVWDNFGAIHGTRVNAAGEILDPLGFSIAAFGAHPQVAWNGTHFLVVWDNNAYDFIRAARVTPEGAVLDPDGFPLSTATTTQHYPSLAWDGAHFLVAWADWRSAIYADIYGARVSPAGEVVDPEGILIFSAPDQQSHPAVAWDGKSFMVAWGDYSCGEARCSDIYGARVNSAGEVLDRAGIPIATGAFYQDYPSVAGSGAQFLIVWHDGAFARADIYGVLLSD